MYAQRLRESLHQQINCRWTPGTASQIQRDAARQNKEASSKPLQGKNLQKNQGGLFWAVLSRMRVVNSVLTRIDYLAGVWGVITDSTPSWRLGRSPSSEPSLTLTHY